MSDLKLSVLLAFRDKASATLKGITGGVKGLTGGLSAAHKKLAELEGQQRTALGFRQALRDTKRLRLEWDAAAKAVSALKAEHAQAGTVTRGMARDMQQALAKSQASRNAYFQQGAAARDMKAKLAAAGITTKQLASREQQLQAQIDKTTRGIERRSAALKASAKWGAIGAGVTATGMAGMYAGGRAVNAARTPFEQSRHAATEEVRIRALGLGEGESRKAIDFAKQFKSFGTSRLDNLELMRDAVTVFNDRHHAEQAMPILSKMKFANKAVFGEEEGGDKSRKFMDMMKVIEMRGGANNLQDFERNANMVQQVITATGGRVGAEDWMHVIQRGKLAAKGFDEKEFFYRLEPLVQEMGGNAVGTGLTAAYQNLYQGRTTKRAAMNLEKFGLIGDPSKVKHDKAGQTSQLNPGALLGADVFRRSQYGWMNTILLPQLAKQGITEEQGVIDAIGSIFSNTNAGALMATMYQQRAMIEKSYQLNHNADNIDQLNAKAKDSPAGKEINYQAKRDDLYARLGDAALPMWVKFLEVVTGVTEKVTAFAAANPGLTKAVVGGAAALTGLALAGSAVLIPIGLLIAKGALLRYVLANVGVTLPTIGSMLGTMASVGARAFGWLGTAARVLMANPIGLAIGLMVTAITMWVTRWQDIKGGAVLLWNDLRNIFTSGLAWLGTLPQRMWQFGADIVQGLINGVTAKLGTLRDTMAGMAESVKLWFTAPVQIRSPSRVFQEYGGFISEGTALGITAKAPMVQRATAAMVALPMMAATPAMAGLGSQPGAGMAAGGDTFNIYLTVPAGADGQAIAQQVAQEVARIKSREASAQLSRMRD